MKIGVLADDLTGAGDAALAFERAGFRTEIALWGARRPAGRPRVWVLETGSRTLSGPAARRRVRQAAGLLKRWKAGFIFKKIDSTLRGPVGPELDGLLEALGSPYAPVSVVPAFPAAGRVTRGGRLFVRGVPLHRTAFGRDPRRPAATSRVADLVGAGRGRRGVRGLRLPDVADAAGLSRAARQVLKDGAPAAAGSAGFAGALARFLPGARGRPAFSWRKSFRGRRRPVLLVNGSAHPLSRRQAARAGEGAALLSAPRRRGRPGPVLSALIRRARAARLSSGARRFAAAGGETAAALARDAGVSRWRILAQVDRGVPLMVTVGERRKSWWVIKPGGFGGEDLWKRAIALLSRT